MRLTVFWERMAERFGTAYADSVARDVSIAALGGRTVAEALAAGEKPKAVWLAVCELFDVPAKDR